MARRTSGLHRACCRVRRAGAGDRGASAIELAILAPILLGLIFLAIQFALWYQGRQVALAAAQDGNRIAREQAEITGGWQAAAESDARNYYAQLGTKVLGDGVTARTELSPVGQVQTTVTGQVALIAPFPGLTLTIHETARGPIECFRPDLNGGQACNG
jgi:Flp pilus assembly protein TadG